MRVIVWGINYAPEKTGIGPYNTGLCEFLAQQGHDVAMLAGFEYYPQWQKNREDQGRIYRDEMRSGVRVHRCWLYVPKNVRALKRIAHELSFIISSFCRALLLKRADVYLVVSPPLVLGLAAAVIAVLKRAPFVFHIQDLQPDAAVCLGMIQADSWLVRLLYRFESATYARATRVSTISPGILRLLRTQKGIPENKLLYFPNWVKPPVALPTRGAFRARHGIPENTFIVLYSGNLGVKQGLTVLVDAARIAQAQSATGKPAIRFVIAGTGALRDEIVAQIEREHLSNVLLLPLQPDDAYREMMVDADCCAITQQPGTGALFFPSKLLTSLAFAKPILSIADNDSDLALAVEEGAFGINVTPGSPAAVIAALEQFASSKTSPDEYGSNGRRYVARFESKAVLTNLETELRRLLPSTLFQAPPPVSPDERQTEVKNAALLE
jgi:colanic acid biosynthesis glycosyl transferase WcaI